MGNPNNNGTLIGRLGADPELKYIPSGDAVASFRFGVKDQFKKDVTHWFDGVAWRKDAEFLANYCHKGDLIAVAFHLKVEEWEDRESGGKRTKVKVEVDGVTNLSPKRDDDDEKPKKKRSRDEDEKPAKKRPTRDEDDDEDDEEDEDEEDEKPAKKGKSKSTDEKPAKKKGKKDDKPAKKKSKSSDDDEDEDEDDEEFEGV